MNPKQGKQGVEILGREWLIRELHRAGIETASPERDKLIDLIAYTTNVSLHKSVPIQMRAASKRLFGVNRKHSEIAGLLLVYVWNLQSDEPQEAYAMTYAEAEKIAYTMGWTKTLSWERGDYFTSNPSEELLRLLEPFRMTPAKWQERIRGS